MNEKKREKFGRGLQVGDIVYHRSRPELGQGVVESVAWSGCTVTFGRSKFSGISTTAVGTLEEIEREQREHKLVAEKKELAIAAMNEVRRLAQEKLEHEQESNRLRMEAEKEKRRLLLEEEEREQSEKTRNELKVLATLPLIEQLKEYGSYKTLLNEFSEFEVANSQLDQLISLDKLQSSISGIHRRREKSYRYTLKQGELPNPKRRQFFARLRRENVDLYSEDAADKWKILRTWFYTAAEWVVEDWATDNNFECFDYNAVNQFHAQDLCINGIDVDVKTTEGVGRRELPVYSLTRKGTTSNEVIIGVSSRRESLDSKESVHYIQGVFDSSKYENIQLPLEYFPLDKSLVNPCYLQSIDIYFGGRDEFTVDRIKYDREVIRHFLNNRILLSPIFYLAIDPPRYLEWSLRNSLPHCHHDFIPLAIELASKNAIELLPHYLADYLLGKIVRKQKVDVSAITEVICSLYMPFDDQKKYIENLLIAREALRKVRCKFHPSETIKEMDIDFHQGVKPTLVARCSKDAKLHTTILTYSWRTGDTLIYGEDGIEVCDADRCGCLTHIHDNRTIGRRACKKYGENGTHRY